MMLQDRTFQQLTSLKLVEFIDLTKAQARVMQQDVEQSYPPCFRLPDPPGWRAMFISPHTSTVISEIELRQYFAVLIKCCSDPC